jgi:ubiquinone biosynthesis protein Coq4
MNEVPYLLRGVKPVTTESSVLISSSKYLNHPRLREWIANIALKRNGPDMPAQAEMYEVIGILDSLRDHDQVEAMITEERKVNPVLDEFYEDGYLPNFTAENLKDYPQGSLGQIFYRDVIAQNYELIIYNRPPPVTQFEYHNHKTRFAHDLEHILSGGGFNYMGELVPNWARITNAFKHLKNPKLAAELTLINFCSTLRYTIRTMFNYAEIWPVCQNAIERGMRVGRESDAFIFARHEDFMHLPLEEARAAMGIRGAEFVDTAAASEHWAERD